MSRETLGRALRPAAAVLSCQGHRLLLTSRESSLEGPFKLTSPIGLTKLYFQLSHSVPGPGFRPAVTAAGGAQATLPATTAPMRGARPHRPENGPGACGATPLSRNDPGTRQIPLENLGVEGVRSWKPDPGAPTRKLSARPPPPPPPPPNGFKSLRVAGSPPPSRPGAGTSAPPVAAPGPAPPASLLPWRRPRRRRPTPPSPRTGISALACPSLPARSGARCRCHGYTPAGQEAGLPCRPGSTLRLWPTRGAVVMATLAPALVSALRFSPLWTTGAGEPRRCHSDASVGLGTARQARPA